MGIKEIDIQSEDMGTSIACLLDTGGADLTLSKVVISALGWLPYSQAEPYIKRFLTEHSPALLRIGIALSGPGYHSEWPPSESCPDQLFQWKVRFNLQ